MKASIKHIASQTLGVTTTQGKVTAMQSLKKQIIDELDKRIKDLEEHRYDEIIVTGNQYDELNQVLAKIIGVPLLKELQDVRDYVLGLPEA